MSEILEQNLPIQLPPGYAQDPQGTAISALTLTLEDQRITSSLIYNTPPAVVSIQSSLCSDSLMRFFYYAAWSIEESYCYETAVEFRTEVEAGNISIINATRAFLTNPQNERIDESTYIFSSEFLGRLLPVAKRALDLVEKEYTEPSATAAYNRLRDAATTFIQEFQLPNQFYYALGLSLEEFPLRQLPLVVPDERGPTNPVAYPFVSDNNIVKEVVGIFDASVLEQEGMNFPILGPEDVFLLLKSASRNPNHPELWIYDLEPAAKFPEIMAECLRDENRISRIRLGQMEQWHGKTWERFRIQGVATSFLDSLAAPATFVFADSTDGEIGLAWWPAKACRIKFGYRLPSALYNHRMKIGQLTQEEENLRQQALRQIVMDREMIEGIA